MAITPFDFAPGEVSSNILQALYQVKNKDLSDLVKCKYLRNSKFDYSSLSYHHIDEYARVTGYTLRFFLFGSEERPASYYTPVDDYVIDILNSLSEEQLSELNSMVTIAYPCKLMDIAENVRPMQRYLAVLDSQRKPLFPKEIPDNEKYKYRKDVLAEILRYTKNCKYSNRFSFNCDYWVDLATLKGVSVRWILGVKETTLYCDSAEADNLFDMFTLMSPLQKYGFLTLLRIFAPNPDPEFIRICDEGSLW